jgi:GDP-6-deoxy-D-talose 4-dehydrogenase
MKKVLVTGIDGFTGKHLANALKLSGLKVIGLSDRSTDADDVFTCDLLDKEKLQQVVSEIQPNYVVHLAAISFVGHNNTDDFYRVNVIGTENLLEALLILEKKPEKVLIASSANVYGNCENSPILETQQPLPVNHYAISKVAMEFMARTYLDRLPLFFTRPFNYVGLGQAESFIIPKLISHFVKKAEVIELGNLNVEREFNDVRFVCDAYLRLLDVAKPGEVYNICSGKLVTLSSVIELLTEMTGHQINVKVNPAFVRKNEVHELFGNPEKLFNTIGTIQQPILKDTLNWILNEN